MKTEFFLRRQLPAVFFHEPELPTGLPDLVAVYMSRNQPKLTPERLGLTKSHIRVLHGLHLLSGASIEELATRLAMPQRTLEKLALALSEAELITVRGGNLSPARLSRAFAVKHIVAIEAKIDNWSKALDQAAANRWFASQSFILIPPNRSITRVTERATQLGVGVLVLADNEINQVLDPKVAPIPASYGSWLFNEWALRLKQSR